jgi:hypothetical protein
MSAGDSKSYLLLSLKVTSSDSVLKVSSENGAPASFAEVVHYSTSAQLGFKFAKVCLVL